jgi:UDP-2,3-diacylglucosamine pyrophosphatase LpxH
VLLGDVIELREGPLRDPLAVATPILGAVGAALRPGGEVVIVPGNHDHVLTAGWSARVAAAGTPPAICM